eukprot:SAG31_NODE_14379_length_810_cov_1.012658_1_plen_100_part_01
MYTNLVRTQVPVDTKFSQYVLRRRTKCSTAVLGESSQLSYQIQLYAGMIGWRPYLDSDRRSRRGDRLGIDCAANALEVNPDAATPTTAISAAPTPQANTA